MISRIPFAQRIVIAFVLMTVVVSGSFSLGIVAVVHFVEDQLITKELHGRLNMVIHEDIKVGRAPRLDARTRFFASNSAEHPIPERFAGVPEGFTEIEDEHEAAYVYLSEINGVRYMLLQEQQEFEDREEILFSVVLAGFLLCIVCAWGLGVIMARHVMAPVARLAGQVRHSDQLDTRTAPLAPGYANDEIGHLAAAFDNTLGQLRRSIERERLFTSDVSHELRTPLMVIATSCELMNESSLLPVHKEHVARISRAAEEMRELVLTFLALARDSVKVLTIERRVTLIQMAQEQGDRLRERILEKGIAFSIVEESCDNGQYNQTFLRTVLANLLRNALHYTERGTIRLVLEQGGFRVEDSGPGVSAEERSQIFEPFVRGHEARGEGLGLGLSLVKRVCAHQGWTIAITDMPPAGSCFRIDFMAQPAMPLE